MGSGWLGLWAVTVTLGVLAGCGATVRNDTEASEKRYLLGADYYSKGAVRPALEELLKAVELNPQNAEAHNLLGILFLRLANDAEEMIQRSSCVRNPQLDLQEIDGQFRQAEERFKKATTLRPDFSEAWNNLSVTQLHFQRWDEAIASALKALSNIVYAGAWAAQANLGWAYFQKKDYLRAAKELRTAIYSNPKFCVGRYRLARLYFEQQSWDQAREELDKLAADKSCPIQEAFQLLGMVAIKQNDHTRAVEAFKRCVELAPASCLAKQCQLAAPP